MAKESVSLIDNRTGKSYEITISYGIYPLDGAAIRASDLRQVKVSEDDFGLMSYDPAYMNTASCKSRITFIDGDKGILRYRGYPIDQLAERAPYLEVAYLILNGELPTKNRLDEWVFAVTHHTMVHENIGEFLAGFRYD